jgi:hypothetical protein
MGRAGAIQESAEGVLNADRKTNTARRADMASGIEGRARQELAKANTIKNISDAMSSGQVQHLSGLRHATQVDTLDAMLRRARSLQYQNALKSDPQAHHNYEEFTSKLHGEEDISHVEFPYPRIWRKLWPMSLS